ncbi:MAG: hypothetical protein HYT80_12120 [Euryarchaeota archaeon]|nr:hypothetical protein [Euryarchaeota archaeon]
MTSRKGVKAVDAWSLVHVASGVGLAVVGVGPWLAVGAIVGFELVEGGLRRISVKGGGGLFEYESWPNVVTDVLVGVAGYVAVHAFWPGLFPFGV